MTFDFEPLEDILVCPKSESKLVLDGHSLVSVDSQCRFKYKIRDGIPNMIVEDATELDLEEWSQVMQRHGRDPITGEPRSDGVTG